MRLDIDNEEYNEDERTEFRNCLDDVLEALQAAIDEADNLNDSIAMRKLEDAFDFIEDMRYREGESIVDEEL